MPAVVRKGDICTGHGGWPPRKNDEGSSNVFVNGIECHRQTDHWITHCNSQPSCHDSQLANGSPNVFVNNLAMARVGDPVACGSKTAQGSSNVFCNG